VTTAERPRRETLTGVASAARILREFGKQHTQLGVSQLARRVGVGRSTAHRIIWTLVEEGLLEKVEDTGLFRLTTTMRSLGASAEVTQRLHEAATIPLDHLRNVTDGTVHVGILDGTDVLYVERREGPGAISVFRLIGMRCSAHLNSSGKVLLAFLPPEQQERLVAGMRLTAKTSRTITSTTIPLSGATSTPVAAEDTTNGPSIVIGQGASPHKRKRTATITSPFLIRWSLPAAPHFARTSRHASLAARRRLRRSDRVVSQTTIRSATSPRAPKSFENQP